MVVVPAGADHHGPPSPPKLVPPDIGGVPYGGYGRHADLGEGRDEQAIVVVQRWEHGARRESDTFHLSKKTI